MNDKRQDGLNLDARLSARELEEAESAGRGLARLMKILKLLRAPQGCPWDREQTHASLRPYLLEECYEVLEAIDAEDMEALREELGDLVMHVVFQAELAEEREDFRLADSLALISDKLLRRHPHVFGGAGSAEGAATAGEVERNWERIKARETKRGARRESILGGVPVSLPGLLRAQRIQEKVAGVGFEWDTVEGALDKFEEEYREFHEALSLGDRRAAAEEFGDFLFSVVNIARYLKIQPEDALRSTNDKFIRRFAHVERRLRETDRDIVETDLETLDRYWEEAKGIDSE